MNVPGFIKLFFPKQNVQTKYRQIYQIPIMTLDKEIAYIPKSVEKNEQVLFLHTQKIAQNKQILQKVLKLKHKNYSVYVIPQQSPYESFDTIKQNTPKGLTILGKMIMNGQSMHPLIKYLKCNSQKLYDFKMLGANTVNQDTGIFIKNLNNNVKYYKKRQMQQFLNKQLNIQQPIPTPSSK